MATANTAKKGKRKARGPARTDRGQVDKQWFLDHMANFHGIKMDPKTGKPIKGISGRQFAPLLGIPYSALSRRLNGETVITADDARQFAKLFKVSAAEVLERAGVSMPVGPKTHKIVGLIKSGRNVKLKKKLGVIDRVAELPSEAVALKMEDRGWTVFYAPSPRVESQAVSRLAIVDGKWLGKLAHNAERGQWDVIGLDGEPVVSGVSIGWAAPVLLIVP